MIDTKRNKSVYTRFFSTNAKLEPYGSHTMKLIRINVFRGPLPLRGAVDDQNRPRTGVLQSGATPIALDNFVAV